MKVLVVKVPKFTEIFKKLNADVESVKLSRKHFKVLLSQITHITCTGVQQHLQMGGGCYKRDRLTVLFKEILPWYMISLNSVPLTITDKPRIVMSASMNKTKNY